MEESTLSQLYLHDTAFQNLMQRRIYNVLLIASPYDAFMIEEDGRVEEQLYFEYVKLNLSSPPRVAKATDYDTALAMLAEKHYDLIIAMPGVDISETFTRAKEIKQAYADVPIVVLTPFSREVSRRLANEDLSAVDYVFSWLGNVDLLLAIIKLLEDSMNADNDVNGIGIQMIMLVENSVRFYSAALPTLYRFLLQQSMEFSTEALNAHEQMLRMRGRPKVVLARDYEEARALYDRYGHNMLGVITDIAFNRDGERDTKAGVRLAEHIRAADPFLPIIAQSSEPENAADVAPLRCAFIDKNSKTFAQDLGDAIMEHFGFGDFIIRDPKSGREILRIHDLKELQNHIFDIPSESLFYHASFNDISRWLYSRAMFPIAEIIKAHRFHDISEAPAVRQLFFDLIVKYRRMKNRGVVAIFNRDRFDYYSNFARIGEGSLGGKGRGLAFIDSIIKRNPVCDNFDGATLSIPHTVVLCTDIFDEFMESNRLYPIALSNIPDDDILAAFLKANLPQRLIPDMKALFEVIDKPIAVRSSSLLEDSHYQPFAGVYATYMIPHLDNRDLMLEMLGNAIKGVYASVFYSESKAYMAAPRNVIDQEKMAIILQEVVGANHDGAYFPSFSGVGRSVNYYPINDETPEEGIAEVAIGLGKYIVDGGLALRFSPHHPANVLQTSTLDLALRDTQTRLYALDTGLADDKAFTTDDGFNIVKRRVQDFAATGALKYMVSTYDHLDQRINDNDLGSGRRVVTFANMLNHGAFPLASTIDFMLSEGQKAMGRPVEIEFAGMVDDTGTMKGQMYWLQIRPIIDRKEMLDENLLQLPRERLIIRSDRALGHGMMDNITAIVSVKPDRFSYSNNSLIAREIEKINARFIAENRNYILIGPGRWGSTDTALGIPVKWAHIAAARLIVEHAIKGNHIEPSQGTHFFQNLTSFGVGYFAVADIDGDDAFIDTEWLSARPATYDSDNVTIVEFDTPITVGINGRKGIGIVVKPDNQNS